MNWYHSHGQTSEREREMVNMDLDMDIGRWWWWWWRRENISYSFSLSLYFIYMSGPQVSSNFDTIFFRFKHFGFSLSSFIYEHYDYFFSNKSMNVLGSTAANMLHAFFLSFSWQVIYLHWEKNLPWFFLAPFTWPSSHVIQSNRAEKKYINR